MNKIKRVSYFFKVMLQILFLAWPILVMFAWMTDPESVVMMGGWINMSFIPRNYAATGSHGSAILHALSFGERFSGFCLSTIPLIIELYIIYSLIKLFNLYQQGEIFSIKNVSYIRNIGYALLISQIIDPLYQFAMGIVLTMHNPPGHRFAAITLDQTNIGILFTAVLVILISWIMAEGYHLREEQQLTI